jgi:hypothetical protein
MHGVLDDYVATRIAATQAEGLIENLIQALEKIDSRRVESSRKLSYRLVCADLADGALIECVGDEELEAVLSDFRSFINGLPE